MKGGEREKQNNQKSVGLVFKNNAGRNKNSANFVKELFRRFNYEKIIINRAGIGDAGDINGPYAVFGSGGRQI